MDPQTTIRGSGGMRIRDQRSQLLTQLLATCAARTRQMMRCTVHALVGRPLALPAELVTRHPVLHQAQWRLGGLPPRIGGWALGQSSVLGIAVGRTVFMAPHAQLDAALLLHEVAHVHQFERERGFLFRYLWESVRRGYGANRFEHEAEAFAESALLSHPPVPAAVAVTRSPSGDARGAEDLPLRGV